MSRAVFLAIATVVIAAMGGLMVSSALYENQVYDEATDLAAGVSCLHTGESRSIRT